MRKESSNSDVYLLVLGRPADPLCTLLSVFLSRKQYAFSVCSSIYQVILELEAVSGSQNVILVTRPAMLLSQAAVFLSRRFPNVRMIGWLDSNENLSDLAAAQVMESGMTVVCSPDQLHSVARSLGPFGLQRASSSEARKEQVAEKLDPMEYKLCDDEMNALLGVE